MLNNTHLTLGSQKATSDFRYVAWIHAAGHALSVSCLAQIYNDLDDKLQLCDDMYECHD